MGINTELRIRTIGSFRVRPGVIGPVSSVEWPSRAVADVAYECPPVVNDPQGLIGAYGTWHRGAFRLSRTLGDHAPHVAEFAWRSRAPTPSGSICILCISPHSVGRPVTCGLTGNGAT